MTRLFISIIITVFGSMFLIGWGLDNLVANQSELEESTDVVIFKQLVEGFSHELNHIDSEHLQQKVDLLAGSYHIDLSLEDAGNIALPPSLAEQLNQPGGLLLASDQQPFLLRQLSEHPSYMIRVALPEMSEDNQPLNIILTAVLYLGVCIILVIWLLPLARRLFLLTKAAAKIGKGDVNVRVNLNKFSYIYPLEQSFNQMAGQIEKLMADNKLLARSLSHDIRTPMSCLRFGVEAALDTQSIEKKNNYLERMESELTRMEEMTSAFLSYASMERQGVNLKLESVNINDFTLALINDFQSLAEQHNIKLECCNLDNPLLINIDVHWVQRALQNLLSNAIQYAKSQVILSLSQQHKAIIITVEDDGTGLDPSKFDVVFDPFVKLDATRSREQGHFGLGLAICAKVVDWHQGKIVASNSERLSGARFTITLPLSDH